MNHPFNLINFSQKSGSYLIEASAGTGKTWTIEKLVMKAILSQANHNSPNTHFQIEEILLITFTNASAKDLKLRIKKEVSNSLQLLTSTTINNKQHAPCCPYLQFLYSIDNKKAQRILALALNNIDHINVYTIHGFCYQLINNHPLFYNFPNKINSDQYVNKKIITQFIRDHLINNSQLNNKIAAWSKIKLAFKKNNTNSQSSIVDIIATQINKNLNHGIFPSSDSSQNQLSFEQLITVLNIKDDKKENLTSSEQIIIKESLINCIIQYSKKLIIPPTNSLSYDDLIDILTTASNSTTLTDYIYNKFPITFIDEFQDTDLQQFSIFNKVYKLETQPRGYLILVGDPKQSIYKFRGADINSYHQASNKVQQKLKLTVNYRSDSNIIEFINSIFDSNLQGKNLFGNDINIYPLIANNNKLGQVTVNYINVSNPKKNPQLNIIKNITNNNIIKLFIDSNNYHQSTAILAEDNKSLSQISKLLAKYNIPYYLAHTNNIFHSITAKKLFILLQAIILPCTEARVNRAITHSFFKNFMIKPNIYKEAIHKYRSLWQQNNILLIAHYLIEDIKFDRQLNSNIESTQLHLTTIVNILHLSEIINDFLKTNSSYHLLDHLKNKIEQSNLNNPVENSIEAIRIAIKKNAIILTTIHSAKGLEFDRIICQSLPLANKNEQSDPSIIQEKYRLIYVALTRAKESLIIYCANSSELISRYKSKNLFFNLFNNFYQQQISNNQFQSNVKFNIIEQEQNYNIKNILNITNQTTSIKSDQINNSNQNSSQYNISLSPDYYNQSYTSISQQNQKYWLNIINDSSQIQLEESNNNIDNNNYQIATAANIFGQAFHKLCELFPFTNKQFMTVVINYKIIIDDIPYLSSLITKAINYKIHHNTKLQELYQDSVCEFKFKIKIIKEITTNQLIKLYNKYYGKPHIFTQYLYKTKSIKPGFLTGFIDLVYEYNQQYWIMDYKTNALVNYTQDQLIYSIAINNYHLQYLIYLIALTQYLKFKFKLSTEQALTKIGGVMFFFVRGAINNQGLFIDHCHQAKKIVNQILQVL